MMPQPKRTLTLFDSTCLIVGIIVGAGIYQMAPDIAGGVGGPLGLLGIWTAGGVLSLAGALCYAELATAYPRVGGDYVYLTRAYGPAAGFLFGWAQTLLMRPGDIAVMAFAFATYARVLFDPLADTGHPRMQQIYAIAAVAVLTGINMVGVREGKWTQNILTVAKALGLLCVVAAGLAAEPMDHPPAASGDTIPFTLALIFVLFTYGGWSEMAYVAAEVKNPARNIVRALLIGTVAVTGLYLLVNGAFLAALGFEGLRASPAVAADTVDAMLPGWGGRVISVLVCISALGAANGLIFAGSRIAYAVGSDHRAFRPLGRWHPRRGTPVRALLLQGAIACLLIAVLGSFINAVIYTAATVYAFYLASTLAVLVLRIREPETSRPFRVPGYPFTPLVFAAACLLLIHGAVVHKPIIALAACGLLLAGVPAYLWSRRVGGSPVR